jgi:hypothetical protein
MRSYAAGTIALLIAAMTAGACVAPGATGDPTSMPAASGVASPSMTLAAGTPTPAPSLPAVPDGLPVMPGALAADPPTEPGSIALWTVDAIGPDVYNYYLDALPAAGFAIQGRFPGGNVAIIRFTTPGGDTFDLALVGDSDGDQVRISLRLPEVP